MMKITNKGFIALAVLCFLSGKPCAAAAADKLPDLRKLMDTPLRDTSLCRGPDGTWYLTGTVPPFWAYNEGIKLWKSPDLLSWEPLGFVWKYGESPWHKPYLEAKKPLWAPEIHYLKGTFWLTYSLPGWKAGDPKGVDAKNSGCGLLRSTTGRAEGPYEDVQPNGRIGDEIDASLFQDGDGSVYFLWHGGKIAKMKPDMSGLAEPYRWLKTTAADPNPKHHAGLCAGIFGKDSFDHVGFEGMFLFQANGLYHLCCAEQFEGRYSCMIAASTNLFGPYGARYEAVPHGGHNMFFQDGQGQWWSSYFGSDRAAPWCERPGVLPVEVGTDGRVRLKGAASPAVAAQEQAAVSRKATAFALQDVRLLDGPFKTAMDRDATYMLSLDADRLLHNFRVNAGLTSSAEPLGNWEKPISELRGHLTGHYLSACALLYASTGDERFKERAALLVRELAKCQAALGASGYLSAFPESLFDRLEKGEKVWAPYYTLHKIFAGLLDAQALCGDAQALDVASKLGDWAVARTGRLSDEQLQQALDTEHGGINESLAELYARTGREPYLTAARRLCHARVLDPLAAGEDKLSGLHANTQIPKVVGAARLHELTGEERYRTLAAFFWDRVANHHSYAMGGNSDHEGFGPPDRLNARVSPFTAESCNTYNMLKLTRHVFSWGPAAAQADFTERALYNHILASQDPRTGRMGYHIPVYGGWFMPYNTPNDSCWCCTGSGFESHAKYGDSIYWRDAEGLFVSLFIPSELAWREKGVKVRQETRYPEEEAARLLFRCDKPAAFALRVRYPGWARRGLTLAVNGEPVAHGAKPGSFVSVSRTWSDGDRVEVTVPMSLRLEPMPDSPSRAAICYGPVVLAGELGTEGIVPPMPYAVKQSDFFKVKQPEMPVLLAGARPVEEWVEPVPGQPLTFRTKGVGQPKDITLVAFHKLSPQRYSLYWDLFTPEQWKAHQAAQAAREQRERELAARTVDAVEIGEDKSEKAHALKGENTKSGAFSSRHYRVADKGGWFSYDLKVPAVQSVKLLCTYWGGDAGSRTFDVLVNDAKVATVKLDHNRPGEFYDEEIVIPETTLAGKQSVTVKFQAHPGNMAGGVFGVRLVRGE